MCRCDEEKLPSNVDDTDDVTMETDENKRNNSENGNIDTDDDTDNSNDADKVAMETGDSEDSNGDSSTETLCPVSSNRAKLMYPLSNI